MLSDKIKETKLSKNNNNCPFQKEDQIHNNYQSVYFHFYCFLEIIFNVKLNILVINFTDTSIVNFAHTINPNRILSL